MRNRVHIHPSTTQELLHRKLRAAAWKAKSPEFDKQVLLIIHPHYSGFETPLRPITAPSSVRVFPVDADVAFGLVQLVVLNVFSALIYSIASYWRQLEIEKRKAVAQRIALALRASHKGGARLRVLFSPLKLFPRSLHPIEVAA